MNNTNRLFPFGRNIGIPFWKLFRILFHKKSSWIFLTSVVIGLSFSISVILGTIGIMDGFESKLKQGLKKSSGDFMAYTQQGFFNLDQDLLKTFQSLEINEYAKIVQTEGFLIFQETTRGVVIRGINPSEFNTVSGLNIQFTNSPSIAIGKELAKHLNIKKGQKIVLALAKGKNNDSLPQLQTYTISSIVNHGIYNKDMRSVYLPLDELQQSLSLKNKINMVMLNRPQHKETDQKDPSENMTDDLDRFSMELTNKLPEFNIRPYWKEFAPLIEAVKVEKLTITLILQIIVVMAIFNVLALVFFLNEKKSQEIFLFQALGLSKKQLFKIWLGLILLVWFISCSISLILVAFFDWALGTFSLFKIPGEIYHLERLTLSISNGSALLIFSLALIWIFFIGLLALVRLKKKSILGLLRKEFC